MKIKIEATLTLVGVVLNAIAMGYENRLLAEDFDSVCDGIVDFGDAGTSNIASQPTHQKKSLTLPLRVISRLLK